MKRNRPWIFIAALVLAVCSLVRAQNSPHGSLSMECTACHLTSSWKEMKTPMDFNHSATAFSLTGRHATTDCKQCHTTLRFAGTANDCYSCHQSDFVKMQMPDHRRGQFSHECTTCHSTGGWKPSIFDHRKTNFQLIGAHIAVDCASCHQNARFAGTPMDCYSCHRSDFAGAMVPKHQSGKFSHDCQSCHTPQAWAPATFNHSATNFPLAGAHATLECISCHPGGQYTMTPTDCYSCHKSDFAKTKAPDHVLGQFDHDCSTCHSSVAWKPSTFNHSKTKFALLGAHIAVDCASCHPAGKFANTPVDCFVCHQTDFNHAPDHASARFGHDCLTCHSMNGWVPSTFDHSKSIFPLTGAHQNVPCTQCHKNGQFTAAPTDCYSCHQADFARPKSPNHQLGQLSHDCTTCHTTMAWRPSTFDHSKTNFVLTGAHLAVECGACHTSGRFAGTPTVCYQCHQTDFNHAPDHSSARFSHDCLLCHSMNGWSPSTFDHSKANFPLQGAHQSVQCASCHKNGQYVSLPTDCYSCHSKDFAGTVNPNHQVNGFSHDCVTCHSLAAWKPSTFNHANTSFPLTGAHATTDCLFCHKAGQYKGLPTDCYSCHQADFTGVADPNHVAANFDHNCATCHTTQAWKPASFDHNTTNFKLTGAHATTECARCHVNNRYAGTPTDCYSCHQQDYTGATNPNHAAAAYPVTCVSCHTTTSWRPSTFDHTPFFPISAGSKHSPGRWTFCSDCHTNPSSPATFECINCHTHNKTTTDAQHRNQSGYLYQSASCYRCHPRGEE